MCKTDLDTPAAGELRRRFLHGPWPAVLLAALCFANSLRGGFAYDDRALVLDNPRIRTLTDVRAVWLSEWWELVESESEVNPKRDRLYRPLALFTFALNYAAGGYHSAGYHLINVALHAAVCFLVWHLGRRLVRDATAATVAAVLFAVHPIHSEAVANVVGRAELLAALFLLSGLLVLQPSDGGPTLRRTLLAAPAFFLALLSKESAVCYPAVALLMLHATRREHSAAHGPGDRATCRRWWLMHAVCLLLPLLAYFPLRYVALEQQLCRTQAVDVLMNPLVTATGMQQVLGPFTVLGHYARLLAVPAHLSCDYGIAIVDPRDGVTVMTLVGLLTAGGMAVALFGFTRRSPLGQRVATLTAMILVSYALISNTVLLIGVALAERFMYWPSVPIFILAAVGIVQFWRRQCTRAPKLEKSGRLLRILGVLLVAALGLRTLVRNSDWASNVQLFATDVATYPEGAHLNKAYAVELLHLWGQTDTPNEKAALLGLAQRHLNAAVEIHPGYAAALALRGRVRAQRGEIDGALLDLEAALQLAPGLRDARETYARVLYGAGAEERLTALEANVSQRPDDPALRLQFGEALLRYGRYSRALVQLEQAVALAPDDVEALLELGKALALTQQEERAIELFGRVLTRAPDQWEAHANLVKLLAERDPAAALRHAVRAHELEPGEPRNGINLAEAYALNGQTAAAVRLYQRVERELDEDDPLRRVVTQRLEVLRENGTF